MCRADRLVSLALIIVILVIKYCSCINFRSNVDIGQDSDLNFSQLAWKYGYYSEKHSVITEDRYILTIFRMNGKRCGVKRPPVLLMHGLLMSSDIFLDAGPDTGLAYLLANNCYDVWVGNNRGNYYSRAHTTLNPDTDPKFWKFSYDEMSYYDVPAIIDYILDQTGDEKLNYIGYSQGGGIAFAMCSDRPSFCEKISILITLAPSTRHVNTKSRFSRALALNCWRYERALSTAGVNEIMGKPESMPDILSMFCRYNLGSEAICLSVITLLDSYHAGSLSRETIRTLFGHFSAGTSVHNMAHYGQTMVSDDFRKFDYGDDNINIYGSEDPPKYDLKATRIPVVIMYGENDGLVDVKDSKWLVLQLPNVLEAYLVPDPKWSHVDFFYSHFIPKLIFSKIQQYLMRFS